MRHTAGIALIEHRKAGNIGQLHRDAADVAPCGAGALKRPAGSSKRALALRDEFSRGAETAEDHAEMRR